MVHCFLTGVQFPMDKAFVLNRRGARDLLAALNDRVVSLRRLIDQLSPLDVEPDLPPHMKRRREDQMPRKHRLVCKAVAEALGPGFPEIKLFLPWPEHQAQVQKTTQRKLRGHQVHGEAIQKLDAAALREGNELGRSALQLLDPKRQLAPRTRVAISAAACAHLRGRTAEAVVQLIRDAVAGKGEPGAAGLTAKDLADVREFIATVPLESAK
jgi:hypothetical protein